MLNKQRSQLRTVYKLRMMAARTGTIIQSKLYVVLKEMIWSCICYSDQSDVFKQRLYSLIYTHTHICIYTKESFIGCAQMSIPPTLCSFFCTHYGFYYFYHLLLYPRLKAARLRLFLSCLLVTLSCKNYINLFKYKSSQMSNNVIT